MHPSARTQAHVRMYVRIYISPRTRASAPAHTHTQQTRTTYIYIYARTQERIILLNLCTDSWTQLMKQKSKRQIILII